MMMRLLVEKGCEVQHGFDGLHLHDQSMSTAQWTDCYCLVNAVEIPNLLVIFFFVNYFEIYLDVMQMSICRMLSFLLFFEVHTYFMIHTKVRKTYYQLHFLFYILFFFSITYLTNN